MAVAIIWTPRRLDRMAIGNRSVAALVVLLVVGYAASRFGTTLFDNLRNAIFERVGQDATRRLASRVFRHLHQLSLRFHLERRTGSLTKIVERGTKSIDMMLYFLLFNIAPTLIELTAICIIFGVKFGPGMVIATLAITIWALIAPDQAEGVLGSVVKWTSSWFGWLYIALVAAVLIFVIFLALSRYGGTKLGPAHSKPEFSLMSWASMLFAAGISTDLMYFSVSEPGTQFLKPPSTKPETVEAARGGTAWMLFHYGISGWGLYALMGRFSPRQAEAREDAPPAPAA